jgi:arginyl-tRNA synthetase
MNIQTLIQTTTIQALSELYQISIDKVEFQATRKDFEGDITVVVFPFLKLIKDNPMSIGTKIGTYLQEKLPEISKFNVVQGFLNIVLSDVYHRQHFYEIWHQETFGMMPVDVSRKSIMVEYSSPNTNKPLHLGHVRNDLLGYSVAQILQAAGNKVYKTQIINDRGIHICKSMLAYQKFGQGETPETSGLKGDKLIGNYYVLFDKKMREQAKPIYEIFRKGDFNSIITVSAATIATKNNYIKHLEGFKNEAINSIDFEKIYSLGEVFEIQIETILDNEIDFSKLPVRIKSIVKDDIEIDKKIDVLNKIIKPIIEIEEKISQEKKDIFEISKNQTELMKEAQQMLLKWEAGDADTVALWKKMNQWVYDGFDVTYKALGVDFDVNYYESNTYLLGKEVVQHGLEQGIFYRKDDGSVWIDLTPDGLDEKIVLRSDGTAVYMTQDIGTAIQRVKDYPDVGGMVYTVGNEQDYHFKVLFLILKKLGYEWAENLYHLSYGMVDLPEGKMKSREGTVVDADDLMKEMTDTAREISKELGKLEGYSETEKEVLYHIIGMGALKYFILKVDPKKRILFDPKESIDFSGNTGPFIQYTYARIQSLLRKADFDYTAEILGALHEKEIAVIKQLAQFPEAVQLAADQHSPAIVANYTYELVKDYNSFYQSVSILAAKTQEEKIFRIQLSKKVGDVIRTAFGLLGIQVPERM